MNARRVSVALDRLVAIMDVDPHAFSVCRIEDGWRMTFPPFRTATIHFVLQGTGHIRVGEAQPVPFASPAVLMVPSGQRHWVGMADDHVHLFEAGEHCSLLGDGLAEFTAGSGDGDTLMLCGALSASYPGSAGIVDLLCPRSAADTVADDIPGSVFEAMRSEIAGAGIGTQMMCQALMKQGLIALLRGARIEGDGARIMEGVGHDPRLARALTAILANPAAAHTVDGLASLSGMSRASFSDHFSRALGQGPIEFVQSARLRIGARLLRTTDLPVKVIARTVGYAGPRPFARAFQGVYGHRPSDHRALAEGGELNEVVDVELSRRF